MLRSVLCHCSVSYIVTKERITVISTNNTNKDKIKSYNLRTMLHLGHAYQKSVTHL